MNSNQPRRSFLKMAAALPAAFLFPLRSLLNHSSRKVEPAISGLNLFSLPPSQRKSCDLYDGFTFSNFIVGENNKFAHAACLSLAKDPDVLKYNPLYIYGPSGVGKTHLLHAVRNHLASTRPELRLRLISAEQYLNECIWGIRKNEMKSFRTRYRFDCDLLIMEDVQILGRGEAVQEEFFFTINHFLEEGKLVVLTSDVSPRRIKGLESRLSSRFEWGLITDIHMPSVKTRMDILRHRVDRQNIQIDDNTLRFIAQISENSVRELEGNLRRLQMYAEFHRIPVTLNLAKKILIG